MKRLSCLLIATAAISVWGLEFTYEKNIQYHPDETLQKEGDYARNKCVLNLRLPVGVSNFATVINFHGGGLVRGSMHYPLWPEESVGRDPVAFVSAGYRLITNATPEQAISDAAAAVAWTLKNISRYGGDPKKVFVTGVSGGGYLTAMIAMDYKWLERHGFKPTDLCGMAPLTGQMTKHFNVRRVGFKDRDAQFNPKVDEWAPLFHASKKPLPPSCFLTGGRDLEWKARVEENALIAASIKACGHNNCEFHETEGTHSGGVYPSRYFLRDFVLKTCNAGGIPRLISGECTVLTPGGTAKSSLAAFLQFFWSTRYPGSDVKVLAADVEDAKSGHVKADRVWAFADGADASADAGQWIQSGAKQVLKLTANAKSVDDVQFDPSGILSSAQELSNDEKDLLVAMQIIDAMSVNPFVARAVIDAQKGVSANDHNVRISNIDLRRGAIAFTYAPKALPFPVTPAYKAVEKYYPLTKRFNQELIVLNKLKAGTYELAFDGVKIGEFSHDEFKNGVNVALLNTPNQRKAQALVKLAEVFTEKLLAWRRNPSPATMDDIEDAREVLNAVRPSVSRVTVKKIAK